MDLDGELSELQSAWLRRHLDGCPACRAFRADATGFTALLRRAPLEQPPAAAHLELPRRRHRGRGILGGALAGATAAGIATLALASGLGNSSGSGGGGPTVRPVAAGNVDLMTLREQRRADLFRSLTDAVDGRSRPVELS